MNSLTNTTITAYGRTWLVREARSLVDAEDAIAMAAVRGSVGSKHLENDVVVADVVALEFLAVSCMGSRDAIGGAP